ncbi:hypothetical protein ACLK11_22725 [Escherichia coli]
MKAQLAEKVVRLQSMMAPFSDRLSVKCFARRSVITGCVRSSGIWHDGDDLYHINSTSTNQKPHPRGSPLPVNSSTS